MSPLDPIALAPAVFLAGILMFLAPCTLPLVPGYLAFIAGVPSSQLAGGGIRSARRRVFFNALAFVIGFSLVFILFGLFAGFIATVLGPWRTILARGAGALIILFGLTMLGVVRIPALDAERRVRIPHFLTVGRWESSLLIGMLFSLGWSPCIGPILGTVLLFATTSSTALQGAFLLGIFSLGMGLPFLATALLIGHIGDTFSGWSRTIQTLSFIGGVILVLFGLLMLLGDTQVLATFFSGIFSGLGYDRLLNHL